jgi:hypothetical protein
MIFDHLKKTYNLDVNCEILEAGDHVGGRLYSYQFPGATKQDGAKCSHDYYDVGAMRFPDIDIMKRFTLPYGPLHSTSPLTLLQNFRLIQAAGDG